MNTRRHTQAAYIRLKVATRRLIEACGGVESAAELCRVKKSSLSEYENRNSDTFMPIDVALDLESFAGEPFVTRALAEETGQTVTQKDFGEGETPSCLALAVGSIARESADVVASLADALADGVLTDQERETVLTECREAARVLANVERILNPDMTGISIPDIGDQQGAVVYRHPRH